MSPYKGRFERQLKFVFPIDVPPRKAPCKLKRLAIVSHQIETSLTEDYSDIVLPRFYFEVALNLYNRWLIDPRTQPPDIVSYPQIMLSDVFNPPFHILARLSNSIIRYIICLPCYESQMQSSPLPAPHTTTVLLTIACSSIPCNECKLQVFLSTREIGH